MSNLEYEIDVGMYGSPKKFQGLEIPKGRLDYETALYLTSELGRRGIHHTITEIDTRCNNQINITSKMLRIPRRQR